MLHLHNKSFDYGKQNNYSLLEKGSLVRSQDVQKCYGTSTININHQNRVRLGTLIVWLPKKFPLGKEKGLVNVLGIQPYVNQEQFYEIL